MSKDGKCGGEYDFQAVRVERMVLLIFGTLVNYFATPKSQQDESYSVVILLHERAETRGSHPADERHGGLEQSETE